MGGHVSAADEGADTNLLTPSHYYRELRQSPAALDRLLKSDEQRPFFDKLRAAARHQRIPYGICETNSFCGGGEQGVSDTFGAALWALDFLWKLAQDGCAGVNMETSINRLDFISWYSSIADNQAEPEYFGMLAFAQSLGGQQITVTTTTELNLSAYA